MNTSELWEQFKTSPSIGLKKQIILNYVNLVHYVIHHSKLSTNNLLDERDFFQYGIEGLSQAVDRFDPNYGTKFETYAIQRIRGKILDELRKIQNKPRVDSGENQEDQMYQTLSLSTAIDDEDGYSLNDVLPSDAETPSAALEKNEMKELLVNAIKKLNERDRLILSLYYYENLDYKEIAALLNITVSRVSQIHSKVIKELKLKLLVLNE